MTEEQREKERAYARQWYAKNRDRVRVQQAEAYAKNPAKTRERSRKWYLENKERARKSRQKYAAENPDMGRNSRRKWRVANLERARWFARKWAKENPERGLQWQAANPEKVRESARKWRANNLEHHRISEHKRRALKVGNGGSFTPQEWEDLKSKYNNKCLKCGRTEIELASLNLGLAMDHVFPIKLSETVMLPLGFLNSIENIQPLCHSFDRGGSGGCNQSKHAKYADYRTTRDEV